MSDLDKISSVFNAKIDTVKNKQGHFNLFFTYSISDLP